MQIYTKDGHYTKTFIKYMREKYKKHLHTDPTDIYDVYEKPSQAKVNAYNYHLVKADYFMKILSHNNHQFTVSYYENEKTMVLFVVATSKNIYKIPLILL